MEVANPTVEELVGSGVALGGAGLVREELGDEGGEFVGGGARRKAERRGDLQRVESRGAVEKGQRARTPCRPSGAEGLSEVLLAELLQALPVGQEGGQGGRGREGGALQVGQFEPQAEIEERKPSSAMHDFETAGGFCRERSLNEGMELAKKVLDHGIVDAGSRRVGKIPLGAADGGIGFALMNKSKRQAL